MTSTTMASNCLHFLSKRFLGMKQTYSCTRHCSTFDKYTPRRACLYVPGNSEKMIKKAPLLDLDCTILDCEDGVALNRKEEARHTIAKMLDELDFKGVEPIVRVNSVESGIADEDLKVTLGGRKLPPTLMLPKVEEPGHLDWFAENLEIAVKDRNLTEPFNLITYVESAKGLLNVKDVFLRGEALTQQGAKFRLAGVVFGSDDFVADIGATRSADGRELLYARQKVVVAAKAFRLQAIDMVQIDYKDTAGLRAQSLEGASLGFTGKQCIHPGQVPVVQAAFSPAPDKVDWATQLIAAFEEHQQSGRGAFTFRGQMIDMPSLLQAKNIVRMHQTTTAKKTAS